MITNDELYLHSLNMKGALTHCGAGFKATPEHAALSAAVDAFMKRCEDEGIGRRDTGPQYSAAELRIRAARAQEQR